MLLSSRSWSVPGSYDWVHVRLRVWMKLTVSAECVGAADTVFNKICHVQSLGDALWSMHADLVGLALDGLCFKLLSLAYWYVKPIVAFSQLRMRCCFLNPANRLPLFM